MAISGRDRKILWGRAASRCAFCRRELVEPLTRADPESVVGDECHIISKSPNGPRAGEEWPRSIDSYSNLILLCKVHHKLVDDQPEHYSSTELRRMKRAHESWVRLNLAVPDDVTNASEPAQPLYAWRLQTGADVMRLLGRAHAYEFANDDPQSEEEVALVGGFLQDVHDYAEMWDIVGPRHKVEAEFELGQDLEALEAAGFLVFGDMRLRRFEAMGKAVGLQTAVLQVIRSDSSRIIDLSDLSAESASHRMQSAQADD